jgi:hypothetical protein
MACGLVALRGILNWAQRARCRARPRLDELSPGAVSKPREDGVTVRVNPYVRSTGPPSSRSFLTGKELDRAQYARRRAGAGLGLAALSTAGTLEHPGKDRVAVRIHRHVRLDPPKVRYGLKCAQLSSRGARAGPDVAAGRPSKHGTTIWSDRDMDGVIRRILGEGLNRAQGSPR